GGCAQPSQIVDNAVQIPLGLEQLHCPLGQTRGCDCSLSLDQARVDIAWNYRFCGIKQAQCKPFARNCWTVVLNQCATLYNPYSWPSPMLAGDAPLHIIVSCHAIFLTILIASSSLPPWNALNKLMWSS